MDGKNHRLYDRIALDVIVDVLNGGRWWRWPDDCFIAMGHAGGAIQRADAVFLKAFRALVDQWIDSGMDADGTETPANRYVRGRWVDSGINADGTGTRSHRYLPGVPKGYSVELFEVLLGWLNRNMPKPALNNDGTIVILDDRPSLHGVDLETYARESAIFYLKELLECPAPYRLGRCKNENCRTYFARRRARKSNIKRGTYCGKCTLIGAAERTKLSRQRRRDQLLNAAANVWSKWKKSNRYPRQAEWVAIQVSQQFPGWPVQAKWVTQNLPEILERLNADAVASDAGQLPSVRNRPPG